MGDNVDQASGVGAVGSYAQSGVTSIDATNRSEPVTKHERQGRYILLLLKSFSAGTRINMVILD